METLKDLHSIVDQLGRIADALNNLNLVVASALLLGIGLFLFLIWRKKI